MSAQQRNRSTISTPAGKTPLLRVGRDSLVYLPTVVIPAAAGIVVIRILTTVFTKEEYGWYNVALSTIGLLKVFGGVWLGTSAARFFLRSRLEKREDSFLSTLFLTTLSSAAIVAAAAFFTIHFGHRSPQANGVLRLATIVAFVSTLFEVLVIVFRAGLRPERYARYWISYTLLKPTVGISLIAVLHLRVEGMLLGFLFSPLFLLVLLTKELGLWSALRWNTYDRRLLRTFVHFGFPLGLTNLATWLLSLSDRYVIQLFRGSEEVGLYSVGYAVPEKTLQFAFMALMLATYPVLVDTFENKGHDQARLLLGQATRLCLLLCSPVLVLLIALPKELVLLLADAKFVAGSRVVPLIAFGLFFFGLNQLAAKGFELYQKSIYIAGIAILAGLFDVVLNFILVPRVGYQGAAISACTSYFIVLTLTVILVRRFMPWDVRLQTVIRIGIAGLVTLVLLAFLRPLLGTSAFSLTAKVPVGLLAFYGTLILIRELRPNDIRSALSFFLHMAGKST